MSVTEFRVWFESEFRDNTLPSQKRWEEVIAKVSALEDRYNPSVKRDSEYETRVIGSFSAYPYEPTVTK